MRILLIILSIFTLMGCTKTIDIELDSEVRLYLSDDKDKKIYLDAKDEAYVVLNQWLKENSSNWLSTSGKYRGGVYLTSGGYGIQVTKNNVILYSINYEQPRAIYVQEIGRNELNEIKYYKE